MTIKDMMEYVNTLLKDSVQRDDWEAATRFTFVLFLLQKDLILELETNLRRVA